MIEQQTRWIIVAAAASEKAIERIKSTSASGPKWPECMCVIMTISNQTDDHALNVLHLLILQMSLLSQLNILHGGAVAQLDPMSCSNWSVMMSSVGLG